MTYTTNGIEITGPDKVKRNQYVTVYAQILDDRHGRPHDAWASACMVVSTVYGGWPVEDNTIGQLAQVEGVSREKQNLPSRGRIFSFGLNLYGMPTRPINERLKMLLTA